MEMDQRRRDQEVKVEQMLLERERAREEAAKEKAKYVVCLRNCTFVNMLMCDPSKGAGTQAAGPECCPTEFHGGAGQENPAQGEHSSPVL